MACFRGDPYSAAASGLSRIVGIHYVWELLGLTGERGMFIKFNVDMYITVSICICIVYSRYLTIPGLRARTIGPWFQPYTNLNPKP